MTQARLGDALGSASRTVIRWEQGRSRPGPDRTLLLAEMVRVEDPELATGLLESAGIAPPPVAAPPRAEAPSPPSLPAVAPPAPRVAPLTPRIAAETVVYAAAEVLDAAPRTAKPAVLAAFARAAELELGVAEILEGLRALS
jgi:transcriptional regulator with XRE-family HTH domain